VLLQLNIAFYLPSIPVLLLFGQVEKLLDAEFGRTASMAMRLMAGAPFHLMAPAVVTAGSLVTHMTACQCNSSRRAGLWSLSPACCLHGLSVQCMC
jgi:hypothetical protein